MIGRFGNGLEAIVRLDDERHLARLHRRLYAFVRRLGRSADTARTHRSILLTMAKEVGAQTGALATYNDSEQALMIAATLGYPSAIVEHVRIHPGEGVIGQAFVSGRPAIRQPDDATRRLRYQTDSFMIVPLVASGQCLAVVTLTDPTDGQAFDPETSHPRACWRHRRPWLSRGSASPRASTS